MTEIEMSLPIGARLRKERDARALSLEKVSQDTHIKIHYLTALEAGDMDALPSAAQGRGFLRVYAGYLGLNLDEILAEGPSPEEVPESRAEADTPSSSPQKSHEDQSASEIFAGIGAQLRERRELLGFSLEDVERQTHIRVHFLRALEDGDLPRLPSPVQGRGMLNNYANLLGLDPDPILLRFADGLQADLARKQAGSRRPTTRTRPYGATASRFRWIISVDMIVGGLLILILVIFVIWGAVRITAAQAPSGETPTAPSIAAILLPSPSATPPAEPLTTTPASDEPRGGANGVGTSPPLQEDAEVVVPEIDGAVQVYVIVRQRAWMRVMIDGQEEFSGRVAGGEALQFAGDEYVEILTGNGGALDVFYNTQEIGPLGFYGEVVNRIFSVNGIFTPTATLTPTATATVPTTPTPSPSPTATATLPASP